MQEETFHFQISTLAIFSSAFFFYRIFQWAISTFMNNFKVNLTFGEKYINLARTKSEAPIKYII